MESKNIKKEFEGDYSGVRALQLEFSPSGKIGAIRKIKIQIRNRSKIQLLGLVSHSGDFRSSHRKQLVYIQIASSKNVLQPIYYLPF